MERPTDIFLIVVVVTVGGIALFAGYRMGVKDGHQGGIHLGRRIERAQIEREARYLPPPPAQGYLLQAHAEPLGLPMPAEARRSQAEDAWTASEPFDYNTPAAGPDNNAWHASEPFDYNYPPAEPENHAWHASEPFEVANPVSDGDDQSDVY